MAAETLLRLLESSAILQDDPDRQLCIVRRDPGYAVAAENIYLATMATLDEAILLMTVSTYVFNLKVTRKTRNVQYFVVTKILGVEAEVRPSESAHRELAALAGSL